MKENECSKLILWDLDGTLMHCGSDGTKALNETFFKLYGIVDAFSSAGIGHSMDSVILERILQNNRLEIAELEKIKSEYIITLRDILDRDEKKRILPGISEILGYVRDSKTCHNALLTSNLQRGAETKLESVGLHTYIPVGGYGDAYGEKWDAAVTAIRQAEDFYGVNFDKENIFLVGDSAYDIRCAKKLKIVSIGVVTGFADYDTLKDENPDFLYRNLSNWQEIIQIHNWK